MFPVSNPNVTLILQALMAAKMKHAPRASVPLLDGACTLQPYEADECAKTIPYGQLTELLLPSGVRYPMKSGEDVALKTTAVEESQLPPWMMVPTKRRKRNALACKRWLWPDGTVPFDDQVSDVDIKSLLYRAMAEIESASCVRFVAMGKDESQAPKAKKHLTIVQSEPVIGERCRATAGSMSREPKLQLSTACSYGQVLHELYHVMGFAHEHQRPDRNSFVTVNCDNIVPAMSRNFRRLTPASVDLLDEPFDFYSIMMYPLDHFSKNGLPTITPHSEIVDTLDLQSVGSMERLSDGDIRRLNKLYHC